ncbi:acid-sensing ion channel 2-like isoform X3 [Oculina patagonica]
MATQVQPTNPSTNSSNEIVESEKLSFSSKWKCFASNTTLHGLRYVVQSGLSVLRRATWLIFLCASATAYMYNATTSLEKFMSRPIKTVISQETPTDGLKFPAVTICNLNKFMKSKIDMADDDENFEKLGLNISGCSETRAVRGNLTCGQALLCAYHPFGYGLVDKCNTTTRENIINVLNRTSERLFNPEQFLEKYGHDITGMFFLYCLFSFEIVCSEKDFVPILTDKGICYTFNSGDNNSSLYNSTMEGPELGLSILLNVQTNESTASDYSTGLQVIVHDQKTYVNRNNGFNIFPGSHTSVAVKLRQHIRLEAPYKTNCSSKEQLRPEFTLYTKDACLYQCYENAISNLCGCRVVGFPDVKQLPVCSFQDYGCMGRATVTVNLTECPCNNACSELEYEPRVSYSKFPDTSIIKLMRNFYKTNVSASYMQENYIFLQVGFQHMTYEKRQEFPSYGPESLFGELGGNMGLFLGCSLLTICEFIDFLWEVFMSKIKKRSTDANTEPNNSYY